MVPAGQSIFEYDAEVHANRFIGPDTFEEFLVHITADTLAKIRQQYWDLHSIGDKTYDSEQNDNIAKFLSRSK
jgi:hypothetical protein